MLALRVGSRARVQQLLTSGGPADLCIAAVFASSSSVYAHSLDQFHAAAPGERPCGGVPAALEATAGYRCLQLLQMADKRA